jgi:hypothetical protein
VPLNHRIAFVTCAHVPDVHDDDQLVVDALGRRGFEVTAAAWNDPLVDWQRFASVVIRAAWDYHLDEAGYTAWLRQCEAQQVRLWNPATAVLANLDKRYLRDLAAAGVEIVPIDYIERGASQSLRTLLELRTSRGGRCWFNRLQTRSSNRESGRSCSSTGNTVTPC